MSNPLPNLQTQHTISGLTTNSYWWTTFCGCCGATYIPSAAQYVVDTGVIGYAVALSINADNQAKVIDEKAEIASYQLPDGNYINVYLRNM